MNLLFFTGLENQTIAVNPEAVIMVEVGAAYSGEYTAIITAGSVIRVKESFDSVVHALNAWRKKA